MTISLDDWTSMVRPVSERSARLEVERSVLPGGATLFACTGDRPGPTLALLGGVHGDEDEGVLAVRRVLQELTDTRLAGTVLATAPAHAAAWAAHCRTSPIDGKDLARCFPGDAHSGPTSALASGLTEAVIERADLLIDLHSAGLRYSMPLFCGFTRDSPASEASLQAARAFGLPLIWDHLHTAPGRTLTVARDRGIPAIYAECSGGGRIRARDLDAYVRGVLSVMAALGMVPASLAHESNVNQRVVYGGGDLDAGTQAAHDGFFVADTEAGDVLSKGGRLGWLYDYEGNPFEEIRAPWRGMLMFLRRQARVREGDVLFAMARLEEEDT